VCDLHQREEGKETPTLLVARLLEKSHFDNNKFKAHGVFTEQCPFLVSPTRENPVATTRGRSSFLSPALAGTGQQGELTKRQPGPQKALLSHGNKIRPLGETFPQNFSNSFILCVLGFS